MLQRAAAVKAAAKAATIEVIVAIEEIEAAAAAIVATEAIAVVIAAAVAGKRSRSHNQRSNLHPPGRKKTLGRLLLIESVWSYAHTHRQGSGDTERKLVI